MLIASRRLVADPRPAGRAAAAIGAIGMVAGAGVALVDVVTVAFAWIAVLTSTRLTSRWLARAASPSSLRTT